MKSIFVKIFSFFLSIFSMLACGVKNPTFPNPYKTVDLSKFEMTFDDDRPSAYLTNKRSAD